MIVLRCLFFYLLYTNSAMTTYLLFSCGRAPFMMTHRSDFFVKGFAKQFRAADTFEKATTNYSSVIASTTL